MVVNIFDYISFGVSLSEEELNLKSIQVRLFYPNNSELNHNTYKFLERVIIKATMNVIRKVKGITVFGRVKKEDLHLLHQSYCSFRYEEESLILQRFILYFPGHHYVHFYGYTKGKFNTMTKAKTKEFWGIEPDEIDEVELSLFDEYSKFSIIFLFNKKDDVQHISEQIKNRKKSDLRCFISIYTNREEREAKKKSGNKSISKSNIVSDNKVFPSPASAQSSIKTSTIVRDDFIPLMLSDQSKAKTTTTTTTTSTKTTSNIPTQSTVSAKSSANIPGKR